MNGNLYAQYRSRIHETSLPPGTNGWCMSKYDEVTQEWETMGDIPEPTNATGLYPAVFWEQAGNVNHADPSNSFYQGFMSDLNFDFNNRMHIATTICNDSTYESDTHVIYAYSDDSGESFKKPDHTEIMELPIRPRAGDQQGSIVDSVGNPDFDGIYRNASVVFNMEGIPAVSFLTMEDRTVINPTDRDHFRYWNSAELTWSELILSPQESQAGSEHLLDCNGIITFAGSRVWNAQMYRTTEFDHEGYTTYALPEESGVVNLSGADERAIREENVIRWFIQNNDSLMIVSSRFDPVSLDPIPLHWQQNEIGTAPGVSGVFNDVLQVKSSGAGLLDDGSLELQFINDTLIGNGEIEVRIINVDYNEGAFGGLMLSEKRDGTGKFYATTIDYENLKAWANTGDGGSIHFESSESNEPAEWLKIKRLNHTASAYHSDNGMNWNLLDNITMTLPDTLYLGMISGSGGDELGTTRADNLTISVNTEDNLTINDEHVYNLKLYPNPASSTVRIEFQFKINEMNELRIFDLRGQEVTTWHKTNTTKNTIEIDVSCLESGIYFVEIPGKALGKFTKIAP